MFWFISVIDVFKIENLTIQIHFFLIFSSKNTGWGLREGVLGIVGGREKENVLSCLTFLENGLPLLQTILKLRYIHSDISYTLVPFYFTRKHMNSILSKNAAWNTPKIQSRVEKSSNFCTCFFIILIINFYNKASMNNYVTTELQPRHCNVFFLLLFFLSPHLLGFLLNYLLGESCI